MDDDFIFDGEAVGRILAPYATGSGRTNSTAPPLPVVDNAEEHHAQADTLVPPRLRQFWTDGGVPGERSEKCAQLFVALAAAGMPPEHVFAACTLQDTILQRYRDARHGKEHKALRALWSDICNAAQYEKENPRGTARPEDFAILGGQTVNNEKAPKSSHARTPARKLIHVRELSDPVPVHWTIKGWLEHETLGILFGEPAAGKSFLALDIAIHVARGAPWNGHKVTQGGVVYVAGEGHKGIARRLQASALHHGYELATLPMHVSRAAIPMLDTDAVYALIEEVQLLGTLEDFEPRLVVIDTLRRNFGDGDENSTQDAGRFIAAISTLSIVLKCSVLVVHHSGHGDKDRERGSSVLIGDFDARYQALKGETGLLRCMKLKDAPAPAALGFTLDTVALGYQDEDGEDITSAVPAWCAPPEPERDKRMVVKQERNSREREGLIGLAMLCELMDTFPEKAPDDALQLGSPLSVVHVSKWRDRCLAVGITREDSKGALRVALTRSRQWMLDGEYAGWTPDLAYLWPTDAGVERMKRGDNLL